MHEVYEQEGYSGAGFQWASDDDECWNDTANSTDGELSDVGDILTPEPPAAAHEPEPQPTPHEERPPLDIPSSLRSGAGRFELLLRYCQDLTPVTTPSPLGPAPPPPTLERAAALRTYISQEWQQRYHVASFLLHRNRDYLQLEEETAGQRLGLSLLGLPGSGKSTLMNVLAGEIVSPVSNSQGNADLKEATGFFSTNLDDSSKTTVDVEYRLRDIPGFLGTQEEEAVRPGGLYGTFRSWLGWDKAPATCASVMPVGTELGKNYLRRYGVLGSRDGRPAAFGKAEVVGLVLHDRAKHLDVLLQWLLESGAVVFLVVTHSATELAYLESGDLQAYHEARAERLLGLLQGSMQASDALQATALSLPAFFLDTLHANTPPPHAAPERARGAAALIAEQISRARGRREVCALREWLGRGAVERLRLFRLVERKLEEKLRGFHEGRSWSSFLTEVLSNAAALGGGPLGPVAHSFLMSLLNLAGMMDAAGLLPPGSWRERLVAHLKASVNWDSIERASQTSLHNAFFAAVKGGLGLVGGAAWDFVDDLIGLATREALTTMVPFFGTALYALTLSYMRRRMAYAVAQKASLIHRRWIMENL